MCPMDVYLVSIHFLIITQVLEIVVISSIGLTSSVGETPAWIRRAERGLWMFARKLSKEFPYFHLYLASCLVVDIPYSPT